MHSFQTPNPIRLNVHLPKGRIMVVAEETTETRVELTAIHGDAASNAWIAGAEVTRNGDEIMVRFPKARLGLFGRGGAVEARIHAPLGSAARLSAGSGRIETAGRLGQVIASAGSGTIRLDDTDEASATTGSGDIAINASAGSVEAKTGSGRITVGKVGADARITTGSGNIEIGQAGDSLEAFAASGNVQIRRADHGHVHARTVSGQISVSVANGAAALLDITTMSGRVNSNLDSAAAPGEGEKRVELTLSTVSGNVNLARA